MKGTKQAAKKRPAAARTRARATSAPAAKATMRSPTRAPAAKAAAPRKVAKPAKAVEVAESLADTDLEPSEAALDELDARESPASIERAVQREIVRERVELGREAAEAADRRPSAKDPIDTDLYGVHTPKAADRTGLPDNDRAFEDGETWLEALEQRSVEGGPEPEHSVAVVDENDEPPHGDKRDRPVADRGSGGRRGE